MLGLSGLPSALDELSHCAWLFQNSGSEAQGPKCWLRASQYEVMETDLEFKSVWDEGFQFCEQFHVQVIWLRKQHLKYCPTMIWACRQQWATVYWALTLPLIFFLLKIWPGSYPSLGLSLPLCMTRQLGWMGRLQGPFIPIARPHPFQNQAARKTHVFLWKTWVLDSVPEVLRSWGTVGSEDQNGLRSWSVLQVLTVFQTTVDCFGGRQCSLCFPGVWHWKLWSAHLLGRPRWGVRIAPGSLFTIQPWWHSSLRRERPTEEVQLECGGWSLAKLGLFQGEVKEMLTFRGLRDHDSWL